MLPKALPEFHFVHGGVALMWSQENDDKAVGKLVCATIVEELIKILPGAKFTKYIANGQATPLLKYGDLGFEEACFLACCQHVQYVKTYKLAYISDLPGVEMGWQPESFGTHTILSWFRLILSLPWL